MNGWLSPEGEFVACAYYHHYATAHEIAVSRALLIEGYCGEEMLERNGWAHLTSNASGYDSNIFFAEDYEYHGRTTEAQIKWLHEHYEELAVDQKCRFTYILVAIDA